MRTYIACAGDASSPHTFGGLPYHLSQVGVASAFVERPLSFKLDSAGIKFRKSLWSALSLARFNLGGGFQFSDYFLSSLWGSDKIAPSESNHFINIFQLYPSSIIEGPGLKSFYLDQTLYELFNYYGANSKMPMEIKEKIISREVSQYNEAHRVIFRSEWAARSAVYNYGISRDKVKVVLPGANIDASALSRFDKYHNAPEAIGREVKFIFVGKEWRRKGLDRFIRGANIAAKNGANIHLTVVGPRKSEVNIEIDHRVSVNWIGFLDKSADPERYLNLLAAHDVGVLLSRIEAGGVSLREFGRVGLPVIAPLTGGSPEFAMSDRCDLVDPNDTDEDVAKLIYRICEDRQSLKDLKHSAWINKFSFDWKIAVQRLQEAVS